MLAPYADAQSSVMTRALSSPPSAPLVNARYIVGPSPSGAWAEHTNHIAQWSGVAWEFVVPVPGVSAWILDEHDEFYFNGTIWKLPTNGASSFSCRFNRRMLGRVTAVDGDRACDIVVARSPVPGTMVGVVLDGLWISQVGDGTKLGAFCYFSGDGGYTPRALTAVLPGDALYWNGSIAEFEIDTDDVFDFIYEVSDTA